MLGTRAVTNTIYSSWYHLPRLVLELRFKICVNFISPCSFLDRYWLVSEMHFDAAVNTKIIFYYRLLVRMYFTTYQREAPIQLNYILVIFGSGVSSDNLKNN